MGGKGAKRQLPGPEQRKGAWRWAYLVAHQIKGAWRERPFEATVPRRRTDYVYVNRVHRHVPDCLSEFCGRWECRKADMSEWEELPKFQLWMNLKFREGYDWVPAARGFGEFTSILLLVIASEMVYEAVTVATVTTVWSAGAWLYPQWRSSSCQLLRYRSVRLKEEFDERGVAETHWSWVLMSGATLFTPGVRKRVVRERRRVEHWQRLDKRAQKRYCCFRPPTHSYLCTSA